MHDFCSTRVLGARPKLPKFDHFFKNLLQRISKSAHLKEKLNDVDQKALYQTVNFMSPWEGAFTSERGNIHVNGLILLLYRMFLKSSLLLLTQNRNWLHILREHKPLYQNCKSYVPQDRVSGLRMGPKWSIRINVYND